MAADTDMDDRDDAPDTLTALKDLVQSAGWKLLKEQARHEWGDIGYGRRMQEALSSIPAGPDRQWEIARIAEQVDATARAINAIIAWPTQEIAKHAPGKVSGRNPFRRMGLR